MRTCVLTSSGCSTQISSATSGTGEEPPPGWIPPPHSMAGEPLARLLLAARSFLRSDILATPLWQLYRPSTGAVMLLAAIHTCDEVGSPCTAPPRWCPVIRGWAHGTRHRAHGTAPCPQLLPPEAYPRPFCTRASSPSPSLLVSPPGAAAVSSPPRRAPAACSSPRSAGERLWVHDARLPGVLGPLL